MNKLISYMVIVIALAGLVGCSDSSDDELEYDCEGTLAEYEQAIEQQIVRIMNLEEELESMGTAPDCSAVEQELSKANEQLAQAHQKLEAKSPPSYIGLHLLLA